MEEPGGLQSMGLQRVGHDWVTSLSFLPASWETCVQVNKQQLELDMEQWTGSKIGKGVRWGCILSLCLFNFHPEYTMCNAVLVDSQAGIKIARRNTNNLRHADDATLMVESEEELKNLLIEVKEDSEKPGSKVNI